MPKLLMASALIFAVALPASAGELVPGVGQISHTEGYSASVCTNDPSGTLPLRSGPGQHHDEIRQIPSGKNVRVLNSRRSQDGFDWFKISYRDTRGWVRSDYVCNSRYTD